MIQFNERGPEGLVQIPANAGPFVHFQEISGSTRLRGGAGRTRTSEQTVMSEPRRLRGKRIFPVTKSDLCPWASAPASLVRDNLGVFVIVSSFALRTFSTSLSAQFFVKTGSVGA